MPRARGAPLLRGLVCMSALVLALASEEQGTRVEEAAEFIASAVEEGSGARHDRQHVQHGTSRQGGHSHGQGGRVGAEIRANGEFSAAQVDKSNPFGVKIESRHMFKHGRKGEPWKAFDLVTLEFTTVKPVKGLTLRLPERMDCENAQDKVCGGYEFQAKAGSPKLTLCNLHTWADKSKKDKETDLAAKGMKSCSFDNTKGSDGTSIPKRSEATLAFQHELSSTPHQRYFFTIDVKRPSHAPAGEIANSFQVFFKDSNGAFVGDSEGYMIPAGPIVDKFVCSYTPWVATNVCTAKCGGGQHIHTRQLVRKPPEDLDKSMKENCDEDLWKVDPVPCQTKPCSMDCQLADWTRWADGPCTATCGGGYEVQRRTIRMGASGDGAPCAVWSDASRVRFRSCNTQMCEPRCEIDTTKISKTKCSEYCGGGTQMYFNPVIRKDPWPWHKVNKPCPPIKSQACNTNPCNVLDFFPGVDGAKPRVGEWFDLVLVFVLRNLAAMVELTAPPGYLISADSLGNCLFREHNLPRLEGCVVSLSTDGRNIAKLTFLNPLEPSALENQRGSNTKYEIRFWVKHPKECSNSSLPVSSTSEEDSGTPPVHLHTDQDKCHSEKGQRDWTLSTRNDYSLIVESVSIGYELHQSDKVPYVYTGTTIKPGSMDTISQDSEALNYNQGGASATHNGNGGKWVYMEKGKPVVPPLDKNLVLPSLSPQGASTTGGPAAQSKVTTNPAATGNKDTAKHSEIAKKEPGANHISTPAASTHEDLEEDVEDIEEDVNRTPRTTEQPSSAGFEDEVDPNQDNIATVEDEVDEDSTTATKKPQQRAAKKLPQTTPTPSGEQPTREDIEDIQEEQYELEEDEDPDSTNLPTHEDKDKEASNLAQFAAGQRQRAAKGGEGHPARKQRASTRATKHTRRSSS